METEKLNHPYRPKWSFDDIFFVLVALFALMYASQVLSGSIKHAILSLNLEKNTLKNVLLFLGTFIQAIILIGSVLALTRRKGAGVRDLGLNFHNAGRNIVTGLIGGVGLGAAIWLMGVLLSLIMGPPPPQSVEKLLTGIKSGKDLIFPFLSVSILAPISEELYFRGMTYPVARARFGRMAGMILSGIFFGSLHLDLYRLLPISCGGVILAYLYDSTGSLLTPIIAHSVWNTFMLLSLFFVGK